MRDSMRRLLLALWVVTCVGQQCTPSTQLAKAPGILRDRSPQVGNYNPGVDCHWQITTAKPNTIIALTFTLLKLDADYGGNNDVVLVNLGRNAPPPLGWSLYTRPLDLYGGDAVGTFDYATSPLSKDTCVANQQGSFDPSQCDLTYGSLLADASRSASWYYYTGNDGDDTVGGTVSMQSTAQDIYIIYRSFTKPDGVVLDQSTTYGMAATYEFASTFCSGLSVLSPQLSVADGANATTAQTFRDNMLGQNQPNMSCAWLLQPTRLDPTSGTRVLFDSIWMSFNAFQLRGASVVTIYDGASATATVVARFTGENPPPPGFSLQNGQGSLFLTYASLNGPAAPGFTVAWQAAYCPNACSGRHGSCINGECVCVHGWSGPACDIPQGWLCAGTHYNASDGCDCGCGLYDPDCGTLPASVTTCKHSPSLDSTAFDALQGRVFNGDCIYCPLPAVIPEQTPQPNLNWNTSDGSITESCPLVHQCGSGSQCDAYGACVHVGSTSSDILRKQCLSSSDCPASTVCGSNQLCKAPDDFALLFSDPSLLARSNALLGLDSTLGVTIEITLRITSRNSTDVLLSYPGLSVAQSSALTFAIGSSVWPTTVGVDDGRWYSVAWTWDAATGDTTLYSYNETTNTTTVVASGTVATTGVSLIPALPLDVGGFTGALAFLRIWNTVKTPSTLFQSSRTTTSYLVAEYRFRDGSARDLSSYQNDLSLTATGGNAMSPSATYSFAFNVSTSEVNPCLASPVDLTTNTFAVDSVIHVTGIAKVGTWQLRFVDQAGSPILEVSPSDATTVDIAVNGVVTTRVTVADALGQSKALQVRFQRTSGSSVVVCFFDVTCVTVVTAGVATSFETSLPEAIPICITRAASLATLAPIVSEPTTTVNGSRCSFPMTYTQRNCERFRNYMNSKGYSDTMCLQNAQAFATSQLDLALQPCQCTDMPPWLVSSAIKSIDSATGRVTLLVTYNYIKTKVVADDTTQPCGNNCYIYEPVAGHRRRLAATSSSISGPNSPGAGSSFGPGPPSGGGQSTTTTTAHGTDAKQYQATRLFTVNSHGCNVISALLPETSAPAQCVVTGPDASIVQDTISAFSCQTTGGSTDDPATAQPWCLVNGSPEVCLSNVDSCGLRNGNVTLTNATGTIRDGYATTVTAGVRVCRFTIAPTIAPVLAPYTCLVLKLQQLQLSPSDRFTVKGRLAETSLPSQLAAIDLPSLVLNMSSVLIEYTGAGDKSGTPFDGFVLEYSTTLAFPEVGSRHFCQFAATTLPLDPTTHAVVFPTYNLTNSRLTPAITSCRYTFTTSAVSISSVWLRFLDLNLTSTDDRIELYDGNGTTPAALIANITASSFSVLNYAIKMNGASDYIASTDPLPTLPTTVVFWLNVPSSTKADCSVTANCVNSKPKKMKVLGTDHGSIDDAYVTVQLAPDTGFLSVVVSGAEFTVATSVLQDTWLHVALVYQATENDVFAYVDGQRQSVVRTGSVNTSLVAVPAQLFVGGQITLPDATHIAFAGQLQQLRLYDEPKSAVDIVKMQTAACDTADATLLLCYELSTYNATKVLDSSRYGIHGALRGGVYMTPPTLRSSIAFTTFRASTRHLSLLYLPSSTNASSIFRVVVTGHACPTACHHGACAFGVCQCDPGYAGPSCADKLSACDADVLLPGRQGTLEFPPDSYMLQTNFVPPAPPIGYPPGQCLWQLQKSNALIVLQFGATSDLEDTDALTIYDGAAIDNVYHDATTTVGLSAATAIDRALFLQRTNGVAYAVAIFQSSVTATSATVALARANSPLFDVVTYRRGLACADASSVGLTTALAKSLIQAYWWSTSDDAYTTGAAVVQLYFNNYDADSAVVTAEFVTYALDWTTIVSTPYPSVFSFSRRTQPYFVCRNGADVGLDATQTLLSSAWPSRLTKPDLITGMAYRALATPVLSYTGAWTLAPNSVLSGLVRFDFTSALASIEVSNTFTLVINASVVLSSGPQYLLSQENSGVGSLVLQISGVTKGMGQWILGAYNTNQAATVSPASFSGDTMHLVVTFNHGVVTYYVNGLRYSTLDTNAAYENCLNQQWDQYLVTGTWVDCNVFGIAGYSDPSRLVLGGRLVNGNPLQTWQGTVYAAELYDTVLPDSVIAAAYAGPSALSAFEPEAAVVNAVTSPTTATMSTIEVLSASVGEVAVRSVVTRQWSLRRLGCATPPATIVNATAIADALNITAQTHLVANAFDATSVVVSWVAPNSSFLQATLARSRTYNFGLTDTTVLDLLLRYSQQAESVAYVITDLWVNSVSSTTATVTFEMRDASMAIVAATADLTRVNNSWQPPVSVHRLVPPAFASVPFPRCSNSNQSITVSSGVLTDGQVTETMAVPPNTQCQWILQAPGSDRITIDFSHLHVICVEGTLSLIEPGRPPVALCGRHPPYTITTGPNVILSYRVGPLPPQQSSLQSTGFYATYAFSSHTASPNKSDALVAYGAWQVQSLGKGNTQCQLDVSNESVHNAWQVVEASLTTAIDTLCYSSVAMPADNAWVVDSYNASNPGSTDCSMWTPDASVPWTATSLTTVNSTARYSSPLTKASPPALRVTPSMTNSLFRASGSRAQIAFKSALGGRGRFRINYLTPRQYYVAPSSYASGDGASGLGTRESPFTSTFAYLFANVLRDGDMLTLFPGRYEGTGYCGLSFPTSIYVTSLSGPAWTLIACQGSSRGWLLSHAKGLSVIRGLSFTSCTTTASPMRGVALFIGGNALIENCRFYGNQFAGQGTVAVVAPSVTTLRGCTFDSNVATVGAAIAVLSATAILDNCTIHANNATLSGAVFISTYASTSTTLHNPSTVTISACTFTRNLASSVPEAALTINQASVATIGNCFFQNNVGSAIGLDGAYVTINNSVITGNAGSGIRASNTQLFVATTMFGNNTSADKGGGLRAETSTIRSVSNTFLGNAAVVAGGGIYLLSSTFVDVMSVYDSNTVSLIAPTTNRGLGGAIYALNCYDTTLQPLIAITNGTFRANQASFGAAVYLVQSYTRLQYSVFRSNAATKYGGALMVTGTSAQGTEFVVVLERNLYESNAGQYGGSVFVSSSDHVLTTDDVFAHGRATKAGGAIALTAATMIVVENGTFLADVSGTDGGAMYADSNSVVAISDSRFASCVAYRHGGSVYVTSSTVVIDNVTMTNSTAFQYGGGLVLQSQSTTVQLTNLSITASSATKGGAIYLIDCTFQAGDIVNVTIANTTASTMGGALYLVLVTMTIDHLQTEATTSGSGGMMALEDSVVVVSNASIVKAFATKNGGAFYCIISSLVLQASTVGQHTAGANGGAVYGFSSILTLQDSHLVRNAAAGGGAIAVASSTVSTLRVYLAYNSATTGGALSADLSDITLDTSVLLGNTASGLGGAIAVAFNSLTLFHSVLRDNVAAVGGAISMSDLSTFTLHSSVFHNNSVLLGSKPGVVAKGGAISIATISSASFVTNCSFLDNRAGIATGGAVYASMGTASAPPIINVVASNFVNCSSGYGGALYLENAPCSFSNSRWINNSATTGGGGGIYWTSVEPLGLASQIFTNNSAVYGPDVASLPYALQPRYTPPMSNGVVSGEASGQMFAGTLAVHVVDQYLQTVATDNKTQVTLVSLTTSAFVVGTGKATAVRGICNFSTSGVQFTPGLNMTLAVTGGDLLPLHTVEMHLRGCLRGEVLPQGVAQCVKCPIGQFSWNASESVCHACPTGAICGGGDNIQATDGYWRFPNSTGVCTSGRYDGCRLNECLASACNGLLLGNDLASVVVDTGVSGTMGLLLPSNSSGYGTNDTLYVQGATYTVVASSTVSSSSSELQLLVTGSTPLPNTGAVAIYKVQPETCKRGFTGHLCFQCAYGYTRSGKTECVECPSDYTLTVLVLIGGILACIVYAVMLIQMTINKSRTKADLFSIITKIFTSYMQLVSLAGSFDLQWPVVVASMFNTQSAASNPADKLISINCLMNHYKAQSSSSAAATGLSPYHEQLILYLCLPLLCVVVPIIYWKLKFRFTRQRIQRKAWPPLLQGTLGRGTGADVLVLDAEIEDILRAVGEDPTDIVLLGTRSIGKLGEGPQPLSIVKAAYLDAVRSEIHDKSVLSIIVLMFLIHPGVTKQIFQLFSCSELGMDEHGVVMAFLDADLDIPCYDSSHYKWMLCVGLPSVVGITFGIPGFAFGVLRARRATLDDPRTQLQFGFLYDGYKLAHYYWEIWIMMRKVLVSMVSVFLKAWGTGPQSLGATGLIFAALYMHMEATPYELDVVNNLEQTSLLTCLFTMYFGLYLFQPELTSGTRLAVGIVIVVANSIFMVKFARLMLLELKKKALDGLAKVAQHKRMSVVLQKFRRASLDTNGVVTPSGVQLQDGSKHDNDDDDDEDRSGDEWDRVQART
ncbi:hypothetical protein SDRG_13515 [Saprolegnia diclina VS20]|uniref:CUB domain-containing protein n=1 Tax=Saprolegnia diclina (strain VS20) TaxID=1156394 RepID=T0Q5W4_SAPDV|nr:hypothetical protein SDRG_13515 [Saprolegnia diclina VS20]EQC28835.1 hypothetical protein SDRG_13515 [Saprolegnia diclina VS20]|eukprot:XP_008617830.1 hypothetical protein SDRG_13515 [Saprolegnia diclina VS20]